MTIHQLINRESAWAQGADARDKNGDPVNIATVNYYHPPRLKDAKSYSLHGAVVALYPPDKHRDRRLKVMFNLRKAIRKVTGKDIAVAKFNDAPTTTFKDIQKVLTAFRKL